MSTTFSAELIYGVRIPRRAFEASLVVTPASCAHFNPREWYQSHPSFCSKCGVALRPPVLRADFDEAHETLAGYDIRRDGYEGDFHFYLALKHVRVNDSDEARALDEQFLTVLAAREDLTGFAAEFLGSSDFVPKWWLVCTAG